MESLVDNQWQTLLYQCTNPKYGNVNPNPLNFLPCISKLLLNISYDLYDTLYFWYYFFCFCLNYKLSRFLFFLPQVQVWISHVQAWICFYNTNIILYIYFFIKNLFVLYVLFLQLKNVIGIGYLNDIPSYTHLTSL